MKQITSVLFLVLIAIGYQLQAQNSKSVEPSAKLIGAYSGDEIPPHPALEIRLPITAIIQDQKGDFWYGTDGYGVIHFANDTLTHHRLEQGFRGNVVRDILEATDGTIWFATNAGLTKFDPTISESPSPSSFETFNTMDGLPDNNLFCLEMDQKNQLWIGGLGGVSIFDGRSFKQFELPKTPIDPSRSLTSENAVREITIDSQEKIWFATDGGAFIWDGSSLINITEAKGLCSNSVNAILEDQYGSIWFATEHNGVCVKRGDVFEKILAQKDGNSKSCQYIFEDWNGDIWFTLDGDLTYKYNGTEVERAFEPQGCVSHTFRRAYQDTDDKLWFAGWLGLYLAE